MFVFVALSSCFEVIAQAQVSMPVVYHLHNGLDKQEVHSGVQYIEDVSRTLTFAAVSSASQTAWKTYSKDHSISFGFTQSPYWFRFAVRNTTSPNYNNWLFEIAFPPLDSIDVYVPQSNSTMRIFHLGDHVPFHEREIRFRTFVVPLQLPDSTPQTVYLRVHTTSSFNLPMTLYKREAFIETSIASLLVFGIFIGVVIVLTLYNLLPFFISREQIYLRYLVYMFGAVLFILTYNGITAEYIFPQSGFLLQYATLFSVGVVCLGLTLLLQEFLQTKNFPRLHRMLNGVVLYWIATMMAGLFFDYLTVNMMQALAMVPCFILFAFISFRVQKKSNSKNEYFLFVNLAFYGALISGLITMFTNIGVINNSALTRSSTQISILFDGIMFSLALAQRFQRLRQDKIAAQDETLRLQRDQNIILQTAVEERTAELQQRQMMLEHQAIEIGVINSQLQEQNITLSELNTEKNELMGIVAHDLKNPIGAVRSFAELMQDGFIPHEEVPHISRKIVNTSDRMLDLVTNLLDINRLESGAAQFTIVQIDVKPILNMIVAGYHSQATAKNITLHFSTETSETRVFADEQAVQQVFDNIISNAVKYSPHGKNVVVRIKTSGDAVRVEVQDEGQGISEEDMKKLFGKFARLSARPTGGEHSTGLGLSIVKKMVEAMNGRVWCESEVGDGLPTGATFIVELPATTIP